MSRDCFEETDAEAGIEVSPEEVVARFVASARKWDDSEIFGGGLE